MLVGYDRRRGEPRVTRRFLRGRVVFYGLLMLMGVSVFGFATTQRRPFEANLSRAPGRAYTVEAERVHNVFQLHIVNKRPGPRTFRIAVLGPQEADTTIGQTEVALESLADVKIPVHVFVAASAFVPGAKTQLSITCADPDGELTRLATATLLGPSSRRR